MSIFKGSATAMITPFKNGEVDFDAFSRLIDFQLDNNCFQQSFLVDFRLKLS